MSPRDLCWGLASLATCVACAIPPPTTAPTVASVGKVDARPLSPAPPSSPARREPPPLTWIIGDGGSTGFVPAVRDSESTIFYGVDDASGVTEVLDTHGRAALSISANKLCAVKTILTARRESVSLDLDIMSPITDDVASCLREIRPPALAFYTPSSGELSPPIEAILTHLDGCEALGVNAASDAVAKLLGARAGSPDGARLETVNLVHGRMSPEGFRALAQRKGLRAVGFRGVGPVRASGETGIAALGSLPALERVDLSYSHVKDADLRAFAHAKRIRWLSLEATDVSDEGVAQLATIASLRELNLMFTKVGDPAIEALAALSGLERLRLTRTDVTDRGAQALLEMSALVDLDLALTKVTDASLDGLATLPKLARVHLPDTLSQAAVERFKRMRPDVAVRWFPPSP
ncbi:MAG: hypothetical protein R3B36_24070 [Polyangiaceae bacterium]